MAQRPTLDVPKFSKRDVIADEFEVVKKLGEGGCGSVYQCRWRPKPDTEVALKLLENPADHRRFTREAKVLRGVKSPHVVRFKGSGFHGQHPYIVLEFIDGGSVRDLLEARGKLAVDEAAWVLIQTIRGLKAVGTVHRDLKPENLLIDKRGKQRVNLLVGDVATGAVVKVADFGLAKLADPKITRLTNSGQIMGTPVYMSPEQCRNTKNVGPRGDIYALGIMLFEMVVGRPPFDASNVYDIMAKHCNDAPEYPARMDARLKAVLERCLAKSPSSRYGSLASLERDLLKLAGLEEEVSAGSGRGLLWVLLAFAATAGVAWILRGRWWHLVEPWLPK